MLLLPGMYLFTCYVGIERRTCFNHQGQEPATAIRTNRNIILMFSLLLIISTTDGNSTEAMKRSYTPGERHSSSAMCTSAEHHVQFHRCNYGYHPFVQTLCRFAGAQRFLGTYRDAW